MRTSIIALGAALLLAAAPALAQQAPDYIARAVTETPRSDAQRALDEARHPAETLAFTGIQPGWRVLELVPGGGYFTKIMSGVVGPQGRIYALQPNEAVTAFPQYRTPMDAIDADPNFDNVSVLFDPIAAFTVPEPVDMVFTAQNYHDLYVDFMGPADVPAVNQAVFNALKPGGVYVILDHSAVDGSGHEATSTLHRIDRQAVIDEVTAAGFEFVGDSDILANADDPRTANVFDAAIRRRTDQFLLKFRKPD